MATCNCPDEVIVSLRGIVQTELNRILSVKRATAGIGTSISNCPAGVVTDIANASSSSIPSFAIVNPLKILEYLLCPLFPFAFPPPMDLSKFSKLDPRIQLAKIRALLGKVIDKASKEFQDLLNMSPHSKVIHALQKFLSELLRTGCNAGSIAHALICSAAVRVLCEEEYESGPYKKFETEVADFSFSGGIPSGIDGNLKAALKKLQSSKTKMAALKKALG
jgi:hypothetical protein